MSILIKGMEMPKKCVSCPLSHWNKLDELTGCKLHQKYIPNAEKEFWGKDRPDWCPLVEVAIQSADIAEIRHGEWEESQKTSISAERHRKIHYNIYKCSRCNHANGKHKSNFCPNCGAIMDVKHEL